MDLISRQDAIDAVDVKCLHRGIVKGLQEILKDLPTAQPTEASCWGCNCQKMERLKEQKTFSEMVHLHDADLPSAQPERKKGEWIPSGENTYTCSVCGKTIITNKDYIKEHKWCFGCGADMRGKQE